MMCMYAQTSPCMHFSDGEVLGLSVVNRTSLLFFVCVYPLVNLSSPV
jgi:hypothetical protein